MFSVKFIFIFLFTLVSQNIFSNTIYKITIMGKINSETLYLPNEGKFNSFKVDAAFSDSDGNFGDAIGRGVIETNNNNKITNLYAVLIFKTTDGSTMFTRPVRTESDIKAGTGSFDILYATGAFKKYLNFNCKYAISRTSSNAFIQKNACKKSF